MRATSTVLAMLVAGPLTATCAGAEKPNFVFFLVDDK